MPPYYDKHKKKIDFSAVLEAIKLIKIGKNSIRAVAKSTNIARVTLSRYIDKLEKAKIDVLTASDDAMITFFKGIVVPGAKPIFSDQEEQALMKYALKASDIYYGLSISELRTLAFQYAKSIKCSYPQSWDENLTASYDWYYSFMNRHPNLSLRTPEQISQNRAEAFCKENVDAFFTNLRSLLDTTSFEPNRIWNMDETGLPTVPNKVVGRQGKTRIGTSTSAESGTIVSMALAVSASGHSIPPFFVFPRKNMKAIYMIHATHGAQGVANGSGWMTSEVFLTYMDHFIKFSDASAGSPTLLLLDNHPSHLSIDVIDKALAHDITMLSFPPHYTHRMQPLDVAVFGSLKTIYAQKHDDWKQANVGVVFDLHHVPLIVDRCFDIAVTPKNIKSGFRACGIFPFDANVFNEVDFIASKLSSEGQRSGSDEKSADEQRSFTVTDGEIETTANETVTTSESLAVANTSQKSKEILAPKKRKSRSQSARHDSSDDDDDFDYCVVCLESMSKKLTKNNSIECIKCGRDVHAKCVHTSANTFTCPNCISD